MIKPFIQCLFHSDHSFLYLVHIHSALIHSGSYSFLFDYMYFLSNPLLLHSFPFMFLLAYLILISTKQNGKNALIHHCFCFFQSLGFLTDHILPSKFYKHLHILKIDHVFSIFNICYTKVHKYIYLCFDSFFWSFLQSNILSNTTTLVCDMLMFSSIFLMLYRVYLKFSANNSNSQSTQS